MNALYDELEQKMKEKESQIVKNNSNYDKTNDEKEQEIEKFRKEITELK